MPSERKPAAPALIALTVLAMSALFIYPIFLCAWWWSHDLDLMPAMGVEFISGIEAGQLYPRWSPDLSSGLGYPIFDFYPAGFFFLTAAVHEASGADLLLAM